MVGAQAAPAANSRRCHGPCVSPFSGGSGSLGNRAPDFLASPPQLVAGDGEESGFGLHELKKWSDQYKRGGREALKRHPGIADDLELEQARQLIAKQALELELIKKARALAEDRRP